MDRSQIITLDDVIEQCKQIQTTLWNLVGKDAASPVLNAAKTADQLFLELEHAIAKARAQ